MKRWLFLVVFLGLAMWLTAPASAQSDLIKIQQALEKTMVGQEPLTEDDVRTYLTNVEAIYRLRFEPDRMPEAIKATDGWTESRFAYVTTKMAVGMSMLMRRDDPRLANLPEFVKPTPAELTLIKQYQEDLGRVMEQLQAKYSGSPS